jgi:hypothetical protein
MGNTDSMRVSWIVRAPRARVRAACLDGSERATTAGGGASLGALDVPRGTRS